MNTMERKYALSKIGSGDYLLPSNDAKTIWRIARYTDGPTSGLEIPHDREFWGVWRWMKPRHETVDVEDWAEWEFWEGTHDTRQESIDRALSFQT